MRRIDIKLFVILFLAVASAVEPAVAEDDASRLAVAREVIEQVHAEAAIKQIFPLFMSQIRTLLVQQNPEVAKELDELIPRFTQKFLGDLDQLKLEIAKLYAKQLTEQELREVLAFYKSPAGAKLIAAQPEIARQSLELGKAWGQKNAAQTLEDIKSELRKRGHNI